MEIEHNIEPILTDWAMENFVVYPWTQEIHNMKCDCKRYSQPAKKVTPETAYDLIDEKDFGVGDCVTVEEKTE